MAIAGMKLRVNGGAYVDRIIDTGAVVYSHVIDELETGVEYTAEVAFYGSGGVQSNWSAPASLAPFGVAMITNGSGSAINSAGNAIAVPQF